MCRYFRSAIWFDAFDYWLECEFEMWKKNVGTFEWAAKSDVYTGVDAESFISMPIGGWNLHGTRNVSFT